MGGDGHSWTDLCKICLMWVSKIPQGTPMRAYLISHMKWYSFDVIPVQRGVISVGGSMCGY